MRERLLPALQAAHDAADQGAVRTLDKAVRSLEGQITRVLREQQAAELHATKRRALAADYAEVLAAAPHLTTQLMDATTSEELDQVRAALVRTRAELDRAADRAYVLAQAEHALTDLGYAVDVVHDRGVDRLTARSATFRSHALQVLFPSDDAGWHTRAVAFGATDARDDASFEQASCADVDRLLADLGRRGVQIDVTRRLPVGTLPVLRAVSSTVSQAAIRGTTRNQPRVRSLDT